MPQEEPKILIIDDDPLIRASLYEELCREGYTVFMANDGAEAIHSFEQNPCPIVITDLKIPKMDGLQLLQALRQKSPDVAIILMTGFGTIESAVAAMKQGASDYVVKPLADGEILHLIRRICRERTLSAENEELRQQLAASTPDHFQGMVGRHPSMRRVYSIIEAVASTKATVLIRGESGTGKGLVARAIHNCDANRKDKPFIEVSCGALPETMLESELFGHVRGSFTGAIRDRVGRFELAHEGTIFLDEIDTLTPALQVKLLRVLQNGQFERVGDTKTFQMDARVIVAMNRDPEAAVKAGTFREDLYYRLNVITLAVPPLREHKEDILLLVDHFLGLSAARLERKKPAMTPAALDLLRTHDWPGNVRELENAIEQAVVFSRGKAVTQEDLPERIRRSVMAQPSPVLTHGSDAARTLRQNLSEPECQLIRNALDTAGWNCQKAAAALGINRATLYNKMKKYDIPLKSRQRAQHPRQSGAA